MGINCSHFWSKGLSLVGHAIMSGVLDRAVHRWRANQLRHYMDSYRRVYGAGGFIVLDAAIDPSRFELARVDVEEDALVAYHVRVSGGTPDRPHTRCCCGLDCVRPTPDRDSAVPPLASPEASLVIDGEDVTSLRELGFRDSDIVGPVDSGGVSDLYPEFMRRMRGSPGPEIEGETAGLAAGRGGDEDASSAVSGAIAPSRVVPAVPARCSSVASPGAVPQPSGAGFAVHADGGCEDDLRGVPDVDVPVPEAGGLETACSGCGVAGCGCVRDCGGTRHDCGDLGGEVGVEPAVLEVEPPEPFGGGEVADDPSDVAIGGVLDDSRSSGASVGESTFYVTCVEDAIGSDPEVSVGVADGDVPSVDDGEVCVTSL